MKHQSSILITGAGSGIGRYLYEQLDGIGLDRENAEQIFSELKNKGASVIIHCAFNSARDIGSEALPDYLADNVFLTERLLNLPHEKFVFFSSVDVYPPDLAKHREDENIPLSSVRGMYAATKLISEALIEKQSRNFLILRCSGLLGKYSRKNSNLFRILNEDMPQLSLRSDSRLNYVLYSDILDFIKLALAKDYQGIYNAAGSENAKLSEIVALFHKKAKYGSFRYDVGEIDTQKIISLLPQFKKTSLETIRQFIKDKNNL